MTGPLSGYRIVDISQVVSGPLATMMLADQGADVIKIEPTAGGDITRANQVLIGGISGLIANMNRSKRGVAVDVTSPDGLEFLLRLCDTADVFVQNFRPGVCDRLGFGKEVVMGRNPDLIYVDISGYGQSGPYNDRRVYDPVIQGLTGHVAAQVNPEVPFNDVHRTIVADKSTSYTVAQAVTAALLARERGLCRGQAIDVAMIDAALAFFWPDGMMSRTILDDPMFGQRPTLAQTMRVTRCGEGQLIYFAGTDKERHGLFRALGHPEWCEDPRFCNVQAVLKPENFVALGEVLEAAFLEWDAEELLLRLLAEEVPCGPVHTLDSLIDDEQLAHNGTFFEWDHPTAGRIRQVRPAPRFSATPAQPQPLIPTLGQHNDEIAAEIGYTSEQISELRAKGVLS
jgi:crotonobetainyl-CoA:carnitine CoA-transferase CaiB-like acyl-CoA transferase